MLTSYHTRVGQDSCWPRGKHAMAVNHVVSPAMKQHTQYVTGAPDEVHDSQDTLQTKI